MKTVKFFAFSKLSSDNFLLGYYKPQAAENWKGHLKLLLEAAKFPQTEISSQKQIQPQISFVAAFSP